MNSSIYKKQFSIAIMQMSYAKSQHIIMCYMIYASGKLSLHIKIKNLKRNKILLKKIKAKKLRN